MKRPSLNQSGIGHIMVIGAITLTAVAGATFIAVKHAHDKSSQASASQLNGVDNKSKLTKPKGKAESLTTASTAGDDLSIPAPAATVGSSVPTKPATSTNTEHTAPKPAPVAATTPPAPAPAPAPQPVATPVSVLTEVINNFENHGGPINVTRDTVTVAGPIRDATARPIVFGFENKLYYAYTQTYWPNFKTTPAETANTMAIIPANVASIAQVSAHFDKSANLVDSYITAVGFSTGGN